MAAAYQPQSIFPDSYVGFDSITKQIEKKSVKRGFQYSTSSALVGFSPSRVPL